MRTVATNQAEPRYIPLPLSEDVDAWLTLAYKAGLEQGFQAAQEEVENNAP